MGLPSGSLLLAGGQYSSFPEKAIWLLDYDIWTKIGDLKNVNLKKQK